MLGMDSVNKFPSVALKNGYTYKSMAVEHPSQILHGYLSPSSIQIAGVQKGWREGCEGSDIMSVAFLTYWSV